MTPETLVRDPEAPEAAPEQAETPPTDGTPPEGVAAVEVERPCPSCGAALAPDQDWCLECGSATAGRSGGLPGWKTAAATIAVCLTLASGAVAAAYAAINAEDAPSTPADQTVAMAAVDDGPDLGAAPAIAPPAPPAPPADEAVPPPAEPPAAEAPVTPPAPAPTPAPVAPINPVPSTPPPSTGGEEPSGSGEEPKGEEGSGKGPSDPEPKPPIKRTPLVAVDLSAATAATYDPAQHPPEVFTDPMAALDGDPATAWTATLTPEEIVAPGLGLTVDLGEEIGVRRLVVTPTTPGTTIEVLGTRRATPPASLDDKGWISLATQLDVQGKTKIPLGDGTEKVRHVAVVFADGPTDGSPSVGIGELSLFE